MSDWKQRLTRDLEAILREEDPRPKISAYHNMPYAIFRYPPDAEFALRAEVSLLRTRLEKSERLRKRLQQRVTDLNTALPASKPTSLAPGANFFEAHGQAAAPHARRRSGSILSCFTLTRQKKSSSSSPSPRYALYWHSAPLQT